jgi:hypothetical protein
MRAQRVRRLVAVSAAGILMAGGAAIGAAGTAAAAPAVHTQVTNDGCGDRGDWGDRCFDNRFDHGFDHRFVDGGVVIIVL